MKQALQKSVSRGSLIWRELSKIITDVEVALNGRPLSYVEDHRQLPDLTPNSLLYPQSNIIPDLDAHHIDEHDLRKRAKHIVSRLFGNGGLQNMLEVCENDITVT